MSEKNVLAELEDDEDFQPRYPYDRDNMEREITVVFPTGEYKKVVRVVEFFNEALEDPEAQYFHQGGRIRSSDGKNYGTHPGPDWFIKGHKWERGRPEHEGAI